jgi:hypothetical protein
MKVPCGFCGNMVETTMPGAYRKTTGWAPLRSAGGANAIRLPEPSDEWAHGYCIDNAVRGIAVGQQTLGGAA